MLIICCVYGCTQRGVKVVFRFLTLQEPTLVEIVGKRQKQ